MFLLDDQVHWSASDLTAASTCEYALLRKLDYTLEWEPQTAAVADPLLDHIAALGDVHEKRLLAGFEAAGQVIGIERVAPPYTASKLQAARDATLKAFQAGPAIVYQAAFFDGEFFGYADFVERSDDGWVVCDAKLARSAKPTALLQLGAYADQLHKLGPPLAPTVSLLLGSGARADFSVADIVPVFKERRARLRALLTEHQTEGQPVAWGDERYVACGRCPECAVAINSADDLLVVAGLRLDQRTKLRATGILTATALASATEKPEAMAQATFDKLRSQAALQWKQAQAGPDGPVEYELLESAPKMLSLLPAPSEGDLFFDFEGDPLYDEGDLSKVGLEYLWGVLNTSGHYVPIWAHTSADEKAAFIAFMELAVQRRAQFPDLHIYHYAPYETTALKRLAMRYQVMEKELDDLLRSEVFVDLYATVRGSVRVGQPSYSIKKLEPLYMGDELRSDADDAVGDGGTSVVAYHQYRDWVGSDPDAAAKRLAALADYNQYDCLSTLRLRDWLLDRAEEAGVRDQIVPRVKDVKGDEVVTTNDPLFVDLMARSGPELPAKRTHEEQVYAMLATALGYHQRESKQQWWEHFERLTNPLGEWSAARDVFVVESAEVVADWAVPGGKAKNERRTTRLIGDWTPGSKPGSDARAAYQTPAPPGSSGPDGAPYAAADSAGLTLDDDPRVVILSESRKPGETFSDLPVALVPAAPPRTARLEEAIREIGITAKDATSLPGRAVLDLMARRSPRLTSRAALPVSGVAVDDVVSALRRMTDSYVAIQGPPGTGKTYTGSRVVKELVEKHGWRIGVVAQSHAVVEHMLGAIVKAGLDPTGVGKAKTKRTDPSWTNLANVSKFLKEHADSGCVVGGTAWDFANSNTVPRGSLDLLVIDEAGQFTLAFTLGVSVAAQRLLLLGDPQQLPQVSQGTHAEPVDESALGWLMDGHDTIPSGLGYFLGETFRMYPALSAKVSVLSYDGRLRSAACTTERDLEGVDPGLMVVEVDHTGNRVESAEEAAEVVHQVRAHLGRTWSDPADHDAPRPIGEADILVVAPYNAQVACIRDALRRAGFGGVRVGTVDKFQGQEAPVAIVSMTASSHGDVPRGMGFLLSRNRVNVAVSRAQWRAIVIRSTALTSYMPSSAHGLLDLGAFIGLCNPGKP